MNVSEELVPDVSVIIPIYNTSSYLEECVRSLMEQTLPNIEFIFIDDASTDNSLEILNKILKEYPHRKDFIKIIEHKQNKGISFTRQEGMDLAKGKWLIHCDSDDFVAPEIYEKLFKAGEEGADIVICAYTIFGVEQPTVIKGQGQGQFSNLEIINRLSGLSSQSLHGSLWNKLIKRDLLKNISFPEEISFCEDLLVLYSILTQVENISVRIIPESLYNYRIRRNSLVTKKNKKREEEIKIVIGYLENIKRNSKYPVNDEIISKIVGFLYTLLNISDNQKTIVKDFKNYKKYIHINKELNYFKKLHLRLALNDHHSLASFVFEANKIGKGIIKKSRNLLH